MCQKGFSSMKHPYGGSHLQLLTSTCGDSLDHHQSYQIWDQPANHVCYGRNPYSHNPALRNQTPVASLCRDSSPSYDPICTHTPLSCKLKGNDCPCTSQEVCCSTGPTFFYISLQKRLWTTFPDERWKGKQDCRRTEASNMEEV